MLKLWHSDVTQREDERTVLQTSNIISYWYVIWILFNWSFRVIITSQLNNYVFFSPDMQDWLQRVWSHLLELNFFIFFPNDLIVLKYYFTIIVNISLRLMCVFLISFNCITFRLHRALLPSNFPPWFNNIWD